MRALAGILLVTAGACVESRLERCDDGLVCPAELVCAPVGTGCVTRGEVAACVGRGDGESCVLSSLPIGRCRDGLCIDAAPRLSVVLPGGGVGRVTSSPPAIDCGTVCSAELPYGTTVTLSAHAEGLSSFSGWGPPCAGTGACVVTVTAAISVSATFARPPAPTIAGFVPADGAGRGQPITILGTNFSGVSAITFNGLNQPQFTVVSATQIQTTVPVDASSGPIAIVAAGGTATSATFPVLVADIASLTVMPVASGCVPVRFVVTQAQSRPASVEVEVDPGTGVFQRATGAGPNGVTVTTSPGGMAHAFRWNSAVELPDVRQERVRVRVSASLPGIAGSEGTARVAQLAVFNEPGLAFAPVVPQAVPAPRALAIADLDGDSRHDIVVGGDATTAILLARDGGRFDRGGELPAGWALTVAELDGDGVPDLIRSDQFTVNVHVGNGDGTFASLGVYSDVPERPVVSVADLDSDGIVDLAIAGLFGFEILAGNGDGTFREKLRVPARGGVRLFVADVDGDRHPDLVTHDWDTLSIRYADGHGGFDAPVAYLSAAPFVVLFTVADLNRDGRGDLVVTSVNGATEVFLASREEDRTFLAPYEYETPANPVSITADDIDRDGELDVIVAGMEREVAILRGNGDGTLQAPTELAPMGWLWDAVVGDVTGDDKPDLVVARRDVEELTVLVNTTPLSCTASFVEAARVPASDYVRYVVAGDFDGDGGAELAFTTSTAVIIAARGSAGTFEPVLTLLADEPVQLAAADLNRDGVDDLAVVAHGMPLELEDRILIYLGTRSGTFEAPIDLGPAPGALQGDGVLIAAEDLDGDDDTDLIVGSRALRTLLGDGTGAFKSSEDVAPTPFIATTLAFGDLNRDGVRDMVVGDLSAGITVFLRGRDGTWQSPRRYGPDRTVTDVAVGDLDHDGNPDIVAGSSWTPGIDGALVFLGAGDGTFELRGLHDVGGKPFSVALADLDRDGTLDIATSNKAGNGVAVLFGDGSGDFEPALHIATGRETESLCIADLDADRELDIAVVNGLDKDVSVLLAR